MNMTISKEESIVTQVAAKIASELAVAAGGSNIEVIIGNWATAFDCVKDGLLQAHGTSPAALAAVQQIRTVEDAVAAVSAAMPGVTEVTPAESGYAVRIKGDQHGDIPAWLVTACEKAGVTEVWDNRAKAAGTKQPWFREVISKQAKDAGVEAKAFWPPKVA